MALFEPMHKVVGFLGREECFDIPLDSELLPTIHAFVGPDRTESTEWPLQVYDMAQQLDRALGAEAARVFTAVAVELYTDGDGFLDDVVYQGIMDDTLDITDMRGDVGAPRFMSEIHTKHSQPGSIFRDNAPFRETFLLTVLEIASRVLKEEIELPEFQKKKQKAAAFRRSIEALWHRMSDRMQLKYNRESSGLSAEKSDKLVDYLKPSILEDPEEYDDDTVEYDAMPIFVKTVCKMFTSKDEFLADVQKLDAENSRNTSAFFDEFHLRICGCTCKPFGRQSPLTVVATERGKTWEKYVWPVLIETLKEM